MIQQSPTERAREVLSRHLGMGTQWLNGYVQLEASSVVAAMIEFASQEAQPAEADGSVMVPREGSDEIALAIVHELQRQASWLGWEPNGIWKAALAGCPKAPATDAGECVGFWATHPDYPGEFSEIDITDGDRKAGWKSQPLYAATPPAPNDDLRAALEDKGERLIAELADAENAGDAEAEEAWHGGAAHGARRMLDIAIAALKENHRG